MLTWLKDGLILLFQKLLGLLLDIAFWIVDLIVSQLNIFPMIPGEIVQVVYNYLDMLFSSAGILGVFLDLEYISLLFPIFLLIKYADKVLKIINFALSKIPFFN